MLKTLRLAYFYFFVAICALLPLPFFFLRPFKGENNGIYFRLLSFFGTKPLGIKFHISGEEVPRDVRPAIIVCNHQHNLDALVASHALQDRIVFLGKKELAYIPFFGLAFPLAGNILVDRSNRRKALRSMEKVKKKLESENLSITIFAEGTRNPSDILLPFKKGAFHLAIQTGLPIIPMAVERYTKKIDLNKAKAGEIKVKFLKAFETANLEPSQASELSQQVSKALEAELQKM